MSVHPATHGLPHPRATTAACDVMPPRPVKMPSATYIPPMSSALVSSRTNMHGLSFERFASSAVNTMTPTAAPGDAGSPFATTFSA